MHSNIKLDTERLREQDHHWVHPWEDFKTLAKTKRTVIARSEGIYLYDSDGKRMIDGPAGMWCVNLGHGRQDMAQAIAEQAITMPYYSPWSLSNVPASILAEKLAALAPGDLKHVFFTTGGSTAVDSALRFTMYLNNCLGRREKKHIISRQDAYHGSTYLSASVSGKQRDKTNLDFERGFIHILPSPNPYRRPDGMTVEEFCDEKVADLENKILELGPDKVAAFIAEPILASGGVIIPPKGYHRRCLEVCRKYDVLYISDEVVTAFGRLGHWFASEDVFDVVPDMITTAKGITSGYLPLGALFISDRLVKMLGSEAAEKGMFANGYTYSGHPVCTAAALKTIEIIENENLLEHVREIGPYFQARLRELEDIPIVGEVRGEGLMACVECVGNRETKEPMTLEYEIGSRIDKHCQAMGLLIRPLYHMFVVSPPFIITRAQVDDLVGIMRKGIEKTLDDLVREGLWKG